MQVLLQTKSKTQSAPLSFFPGLGSTDCLGHTFLTTESRSARHKVISIVKAAFECEGWHVYFSFIGQSKSLLCKPVQHQWRGKVYSPMGGVEERESSLKNNVIEHTELLQNEMPGPEL